MLIKRMMLYLILLFVLLPTFALSQIQEIKEYKVMKGDTLWDISDKELTDTFLWPKIWKENPEITNPDRIYPDQIIKIPLYLLQKEEEMPALRPVVKQEPVKEKEAPESVKVSYLVNKNLLMASGYITDEVNSVGRIAGSPAGRTLFGSNDLIYVKTDDSVNIGDKFYIIRAGSMVSHPATNEKVGYTIEMLGVAEIEKFEYGNIVAKITQSFREIITGDLLDTFYELNQSPAAKSYRRPNIDGYIIATKDLRLINGTFDVIYIDKGRKDGIEIGDMLKTVAVGKQKTPNGAIQIISYRDTTATAIVRESRDPITTGNLITHLE